MNFAQLISLLGKSERDESIQKMLSYHDIEQPLPRPVGDYNNICSSSNSQIHIEFYFELAKSMEHYTKHCLEDEMIFNGLVYYPTTKDFADRVEFPLGVKVQATLGDLTRVFGEPCWKDEKWGTYDWARGKINVSIDFIHSGKKIQRIGYYTNPKVKI